MKTAQTVLTGCLLGAGLGLAAYLTHKAPEPVAVTVDADAPNYALMTEQDTAYWHMNAVRFEVLQVQKTACHVLYGENYRPNDAGACKAGTDCTSCVTHKGVTRNAVIHDNAWVRAPKSGGLDYGALMRQEKLVFQMATADQAKTEAGRKAYDITLRCERLTWVADIQCAKK